MRTICKALIVCLAAAATLRAQPPTVITPGSAVASSVVNANFAGLYSGRVGRWTGSGPPGTVSFSIIGDLYYDTSSPGHVYGCYRIVCTAVGSGNWVLISSSSTIVTTSNFLRGDGAGNAIAGPAVTAAGIVSLFATCSGTQYLGADGNCHTPAAPTIPSTSNLLKGDGAGNALASFAPTAAGVVGLFSTCSGTQYLGADGNCHNASGGGASSVSQLTDCQFTLTSATVITMTTCKAPINGAVSTIAGTTATVSGSTGLTALAYVSNGSDGHAAGSLIIANSASSGVACSACAAVVTSTPSFPASGYLIASWTATSVPGNWDAGGYSDQRGLGGSNWIQSGNGNCSVAQASSSGTTITCTGGASNFVNTQGATSPITMTGADVTIYSTSSVPALASGSCYLLQFSINNNAGSYPTGGLKLWVDATAIISLATGRGGIEYENYSYSYCNNVGSQTAQTLTDLGSGYCNSVPCNAAQSWTNYTFTGLNTTPTAQNWATTHTVKITANQASGTITGFTWRLAQ